MTKQRIPHWFSLVGFIVLSVAIGSALGHIAHKLLPLTIRKAEAMSEEKEDQGIKSPSTTKDLLLRIPREEAKPYDNGPYFTWDTQTIPPTREYDPERDGPYPVVQVHNSQSPGLKKQGRLIRPVTKPDAAYAIWEVDIAGEVIICHDPEEAWVIEHRHGEAGQ